MIFIQIKMMMMIMMMMMMLCFWFRVTVSPSQGPTKNYLRTSARQAWKTHRGSDPSSKTDEHQATQHSTAQCLKEDLGGRHAHHKGHMPYHVGENVAVRERNSQQNPKPKAKQQRQTAPACHIMHNRKKTVIGNLHTASCNQATTVQRGLPRQVFSSGTRSRDR